MGFRDWEPLPGWHCSSRHREKFRRVIQGFRAASCSEVSCRRWEMLVWTRRRQLGGGWGQGGRRHGHITPASPASQPGARPAGHIQQ